MNFSRFYVMKLRKKRYIKYAVSLLAFALVVFAGKAINSSYIKTEPTAISLSDTKDWGLSFRAIGEQPVGNATVAEMKNYDAYYMGNKDEKVLYLTFDCGYENGNTEAILDALKKHNAKGTFFIVGHYLKSAPKLVNRMVSEGHTVANHTYSHPDMSKISDQNSFKNELQSLSQGFTNVTGKDMPMFYRPPQGKYNTENLKMAKDLGYKTFFWSLAYADWDQNNQPTTETAFSKLTTRVHPGAVVLLHNTSKTNAKVIDELLTRWEHMGYTFKPLSDIVK